MVSGIREIFMSKADIAYDAWTRIYQDVLHTGNNKFYEQSKLEEDINTLETYFEEVITPLGIVKTFTPNPRPTNTV